MQAPVVNFSIHYSLIHTNHAINPFCRRQNRNCEPPAAREYIMPNSNCEPYFVTSAGFGALCTVDRLMPQFVGSGS